jgi:hypothetical protein
MGGGAAILKQATAARRSGQERNLAHYPGIKEIWQAIEMPFAFLYCIMQFYLGVQGSSGIINQT